MAENDNTLAPSSEEVKLATLIGSSSKAPLEQPSFDDVLIEKMEALTTSSSSSSKKKGRPRGSKNLPKPPPPPVVIIDDPIKLISVEIEPGNDVVETLINVAQSRQAGIIVMGGYGLVSDVTLLEPLSRALTSHIEGTYRIISLYGIYNINSICPRVSPQCSSFSLCFVDDNRRLIFGGIVGGKVMAASVVLVKAYILKKAEFHKLALNNGFFYDNQVHYPPLPPRPLPPPPPSVSFDVDAIEENRSTHNDD